MTRAADSSTSQNVQRKEEKKKKKSRENGEKRRTGADKKRRRADLLGGQPFWRESNGISTINTSLRFFSSLKANNHFTGSSRIRAACARAGLLMHKQEKNKQAFKCSSKV